MEAAEAQEAEGWAEIVRQHKRRRGAAVKQLQHQVYIEGVAMAEAKQRANERAGAARLAEVRAEATTQRAEAVRRKLRKLRPAAQKGPQHWILTLLNG